MNYEVQRYNSYIGQVPGQTYPGQVVDDKGNGLKSAFFFMDANGKQITNDIGTDEMGSFHFTIPSDNYENIFVQIYSFDAYEPIVKTFDELVSDPKVVLKKKVGDAATSLLPILAIAGISLIVISNKKSKKVGANVYIEKFKRQSGEKKLLLVGGAAAGLYLAYKYFFSYTPTKEQQQFLTDTKNTLDNLAAQYGIVPSLTVSEFNQMSLAIVIAVNDCGTDEQAIYAQFQKLNNEADIYELISVYNVRGYKGCFEGSYFGNVHRTLVETLYGDLGSGEIDNINHILFNKGIKYRV